MDFFKDFFYRGSTTPNSLQSRRVMRSYGLYALAALAAFMAVLLWPFDEPLSDMLSISRMGHKLTPLWWEVVKILRVFGKGDVLLLLGFLLAIHRQKQVAVYACIAILLTGLIVTPMKLAVGRPRPNESDKMSFPSGDVAAMAAFLVPVASTFPAIRPVAFVGVVSVGAVRVANGFHFPSDILAGAAIGIFAGAVVLSLKFSLKPRFRRLLRRSWLAAVLGIFIFIPLFLLGVGNLRRFMSIFGPAVALLVFAPFIRAWLRRRRHADRRLLFWAICLLEGTALVATTWFVVAFVPTLELRLPGFKLADLYLAEAVIGMGCVLFVMTFLSLREYGAGRYRSTVGILMAGVVALIFTIVNFVAFRS